jgi:hypothetical protein
MAYNPVEMKDWQIAEAAEEHINSIWDFSRRIKYERG